MKKLIDLTRKPEDMECLLEEKHLASPGTKYTGMIYRFQYGSMCTTYLDLPGHIKETDDGMTAAAVDPAAYFRQPATVLRPHYDPRTGAVRTADLQQAAAGRILRPTVIINALGDKNDNEVPFRSIYLSLEAVEWLIGKNCRTLVSDVWESRHLDGVFLKFFAAGVGAICNLSRLSELPNGEVLLSTVFLPYPGATQIPCRVLAEVN